MSENTNTKPIAEMTDEEIDALSPEELEAQLEGDPAGDDDTEAETETETGDDTEVETEAETDTEADTETDTEAETQADDADALERLANEDERGDMVPRSRLNEVLADRDDYKLALQTALSNRGVTFERVTEAAETPAELEAYDFIAAQREFAKLVTEGDEEGAAAKLEEIETKRAEQRQHDLQVAEANAFNRMERSNEANRMAAVISALGATFPFLNAEAEGADHDAILAVNAKAKALVAQGKSPAQALSEAGESIGKKFAKLLGLETVAPKKGEKPGEKRSGDKARQAADERTSNAVQRNLNVRQPNTGKSGVGMRDQKPTLDITKLTDEQLDKLPKAELDRLLGIAE